jgi:hypothetical protein
MGRTHSTHGEERKTYRIFVGKTEGKRPLGIPRSMSEGNIKMNLT